MKTSNVAMVGLAGLAAGLLAGLLFAPDKGSETRRKIMKGKENMMDDIKYSFYNLKDRFIKKAEAEKEDIDQVIYKTHSKINEIKSAL